MTRESEGRGVSSNQPIKTLPNGRITKEKEHQSQTQDTPRANTAHAPQNKQTNKPNDEPHRPTKREKESTNRQTKQETRQPAPQNSECNLKISEACERAHSKLLTYSNGDEASSDDCGHHRGLGQTNHASKRTEQDRPAR